MHISKLLLLPIASITIGAAIPSLADLAQRTKLDKIHALSLAVHECHANHAAMMKDRLAGITGFAAEVGKFHEILRELGEMDWKSEL